MIPYLSKCRGLNPHFLIGVVKLSIAASVDFQDYHIPNTNENGIHTTNQNDIGNPVPKESNRDCQKRQLMDSLTILHNPLISSHRCLIEAKVLHDTIIRKEFENVLFLINNLMSIYVSCGLLQEACQMFHRVPKKNVVSWTTIIAGHAQHGHSDEAFELFYLMNSEGVKPNQVTFVSLLSACSDPKFLSRGKQVHFVVVEYGVESHVIVGTALVRMYCNCFSLENMCAMFNGLLIKDIVSWTIMITGYVKHELGSKAMDVFYQMLRESTMPNHYTYNIIVNGCATIPSLEEGKKIHACIVGANYQHCLFIGNSLLDMYAKCGTIETACKLFMRMPKKDIISWNSMITGFAQHGCTDEVFNYFEQLKLNGFVPDQFTFSCVLSVCSSLADLTLGKNIHDEVRRGGLDAQLVVVNALIDMYSKCGCMDEARKLFDNMEARDDISWTTMVSGCAQNDPKKNTLAIHHSMPKRNVFSWTAIIQGYAQHGDYCQALDFFLQMQEEGVEPNHITYATVVGACAGLLDIEKGRVIHRNIIRDGFQFDLNISNALVDMYCRCGNLIDARLVFDGIPNRDAASWNVMIGGYAEHGNGKEAFELSQEMQLSGIQHDEFTISNVLTACRHAGLVCEAYHCLNRVLNSCSITPSVHHYASIIDMLGRVGCLYEAEDFMNRIPCQPNVIVLMSFLSACKNHADTGLAGRFSDLMLTLDPDNAAVHVLLYNIYAGGCRTDDQVNYGQIIC